MHYYQLFELFYHSKLESNVMIDFITINFVQRIRQRLFF